MKFIVKVAPEIIMKSQTVRKRFIQVLANNIRTTLTRHDDTVAVVRHWNFIEVRSRDENQHDKLIELLQCVSGIHHFLEVEESPFRDLHDIFEQALAKVGDSLHNKTFCVRVKRRGKHEFNSLEAMQYVGGGLNQAIETAKVKLTHPDVTVNIEIEDDKVLFVKARHEGLGGFPMSTQEDVLSLISGGFDSGVASYLFMRRGSRVHYLFFNMGGQAHELGTKQMAYQLWQRYSSTHKVRFITVNFEPVVAEILAKIDDGQMGVVLKRMMVRVASQVAKNYRIEAIVTGEALGQVASQTLTNLQMIDKVSETLILRPLITHDKASIIALAEQIGTADIAKSMPEFCGVISKKPTVKAVEHKLLATENDFDFEVLQNAVDTAVCIDIRQITEEAQKPTATVETVYKHTGLADEHTTEQAKECFLADEVVLDVRSPDEAEDEPLVLGSVSVIALPFYRVASAFAELDQSKTYLLYCKRGVMSGLQAVYLKDQGFDNVKVLKI